MAAARFEQVPQVTARDAIGAAIAGAMKNRVVEVWPDNWPVYCLFSQIDNQWRVGPGGAFALDYLVLHRELDDLGLTGEERKRMKSDIFVMEQVALSEMHKSTGSQ